MNGDSLFLLQVLSGSVANTLSNQGKHDTKSTEKFVRMFDRAFDCLNVAKRHDKKPDRRPYYSVDDERFEVNLI